MNKKNICKKCNSEIVKVAYNCTLENFELWDCFCKCGHSMQGFEIEEEKEEYEN